jgi:hypothetical protein
LQWPKVIGELQESPESPMIATIEKARFNPGNLWQSRQFLAIWPMV